MTTELPEYMTDKKKSYTDFEKNSNILSSCHKIAEKTSNNEEPVIVDSFNGVSDEINQISDYDAQEEARINKQLCSSVIINPESIHNRFKACVCKTFTSVSNAISFPFKMINTCINFILLAGARMLGLSPERINTKLFKQLFFLLLMTLAFVNSRKNKGARQNFETYRLFSRHSLVTDFYQGELSLLKKEILASDMTAVMYYAPWDRQCQNFVSHFLKAAQYHHGQVTFAAINCWLPNSECRSYYKLHFYPVVVLHIRVSSSDESLTVPYNGPLSSHHLIRFISKSFRPFIHIANQAELLSVQLESQIIVLGYFDVRNFSNDFLSFYLAAQSRLQFEQMLDVRYALITNPDLAKKLSFSHLPSIHLISWDATLVFPPNAEMNFRNITNFVDTHMTEAIQWLHISGRKSLSLNSVYQGGPFMILFTPDNPYLSTNNVFQIMRSIALEYYNCQQIPLQVWLGEHFHLKNIAELRDSDKICREFLQTRRNNQMQKSVGEGDVVEESKNCVTKEDGICMIEESNSLTHFTWSSFWSSFMESDSMIVENHCLKSNYDPSSSFCTTRNDSLNGKNTLKYHHSLGSLGMEKYALQGPREDERIVELTDWASEEHCKKMVFGSRVAPPQVLKEDGERIRVNGLSCKTNRTLRFIAIDSILHKDFAHQLGLKFMTTKTKLSGSVIIDPEKEERYILDQNISRNSMATFVHNFTYNLLNRGKIFSEISNVRDSCNSGELCVMELSGSRYMELIKNSNKSLIVMHYTHHCGACSAIGATFLTCQHLASGVSNVIFARIDVSKNTLPWHLTFDSVPIIIFHPYDRMSQSKIFNTRLPVTVKNLMMFIMSGVKAADRNSMALKLCGGECKKAVTSQSLLLKVKLCHSINVVSRTLRRYTNTLVLTQSQLTKDPSNLLLLSKYNLFLGLKATANRKLTRIKAKLNHINQLEHFYPLVPLEFSNQLSYETNKMRSISNTKPYS